MSINKIIPYGKQFIDQNDINKVVEVLKSSHLTQGPVVPKFEEAIAQYCGVKFAVAVNSATSALHIACLAAGLEKDDLHWTVPNTFVASANCGLYCGAQVDFVDIDSKSYNFSVEAFENKLNANKNKIPKTLVPVDFAGQSSPYREIYEIAQEHSITIIQDASHGIGGSYLDSKLGACTYSDMTIFSFHPVKIITSGEGGMVLTNNKILYDKLIRLRSHGITRDVNLMEQYFKGPWVYEQVDLGYNYRMTDVQAALGLSQMSKIDEFVKRRQYLVSRYNEKLSGLPLTLPQLVIEGKPAWHLYVVQVKDEAKVNREKLYIELRELGIAANVHYIPVHLQPYYRKLGFKKGDYPVAESYYQHALSLPLYFELSDEEQDYVVECLFRILS